MPMSWILGVVVVLAAYGAFLYNSLVKTRQMVRESWSGIDTELKRRYDLVPNLTETVKAYAAHEKEVLEHVVQDETNKHIAKALGISVRTVETHKQNLLAKVGVNSVAGLVVYALKNGLVDNAKFQEGTD